MQKLLGELVIALDSPLRQVVILRYYHGCSGAEIARQLGIPAGTVRWRLSQALAELRRQLDERHGGDRRVWLRALAPLAALRAPEGDGHTEAARGASATAGKWALGGLAVVALSGGFFCVNRPAHQTGVDSITEAVPPAGSALQWVPAAGRAEPDKKSAVPFSSLATCQEQLQDRRNDLDSAESRWVSMSYPEDLFSKGAPNPLAQATVDSAIAEELKSLGSSPPGYNVECRTWACRIQILLPSSMSAEEQDRVSSVLGRVFGERSSYVDPSFGNVVKDPLNGAIYWPQTAVHRLNRTDGARVPAGSGTIPSPAIAFGPMPQRLDDCAAEYQAIEERLRAARKELELLKKEPGQVFKPKADKFGEGPLDAALTADVKSVLDKLAVPKGRPRPEVECHSGVSQGICRFRFLDPATERTLARSSDFVRRAGWQSRFWADQVGGSGDRYWNLNAREPVAAKFYRELFAELKSSPAYTNCTSTFTGQGDLDVSLFIASPAAGEPQPDHASVGIGGSLAESKLGYCVRDALKELAAARPLPAGATHVGSTLWKLSFFDPPQGKKQ